MPEVVGVGEGERVAERVGEEETDGDTPAVTLAVGVPDVVGVCVGVPEQEAEFDRESDIVELALKVGEGVPETETVEVADEEGEGVLDTDIELEGVGEPTAMLTAHCSWQSAGVAAVASLRHAAHTQHTEMVESGLQFTVNCFVSPDAALGTPIQGEMDPPFCWSGLTDTKRPSLGPTPLGADSVHAGKPVTVEEACPVLA